MYPKDTILNRLDTYILRQFVGPFILTVIVLTVVIWITQSLQRIELVLENGRGLGMFLHLSILIIPNLLVILIPFALFAATLYSLYRMHSDSEIAVMFAAGVSRARIAIPFLLITFLGAIATLYIAVDLSPRTYRILKQRILDIRTDLASSILRSGEFIKVIDGFTIYVKEVNTGNQFTGLLVNDYRNPSETRTYLAQRGVLQETDAGPVLVLIGGTIQSKSSRSDKAEIIPFQQTSIKVGELQKKQELQLELTERYLHELLEPDLGNEWDRVNQSRMIAEAHSRLSAPFHAFAYVLIALYALIGGAYNRRGYIVRISIAAALVIGVRVLSYVLFPFAATYNLMWLLYLLPISIIFLNLALLFDAVPFIGINRGIKPTNATPITYDERRSGPSGGELA